MARGAYKDFWKPCQALFVAACSHVWHFRCIRPIINTPSYPVFVCPNCRAVSDLDAEVEELMPGFEDSEGSGDERATTPEATDTALPIESPMLGGVNSASADPSKSNIGAQLHPISGQGEA